jgi:hypothetical protein
MEAFVYCWTDHLTGKLYVGVHKGSQEDGYICSSKIVKEEYKKRPKDFSRQIIAHGVYKEMVRLESSILESADAAHDEMYYNQHNVDMKRYNKGHDEKTRQKIRETNLKTWQSQELRDSIGRSKIGNKYFCGKTHTEESKHKISQASIGKKMSKDAREKMSTSHQGKSLDEEHKKKISESIAKWWEKRRGS